MVAPSAHFIIHCWNQILTSDLKNRNRLISKFFSWADPEHHLGRENLKVFPIRSLFLRSDVQKLPFFFYFLDLRREIPLFFTSCPLDPHTWCEVTFCSNIISLRRLFWNCTLNFHQHRAKKKLYSPKYWIREKAERKTENERKKRARWKENVCGVENGVKWTEKRVHRKRDERRIRREEEDTKKRVEG